MEKRTERAGLSPERLKELMFDHALKSEALAAKIGVAGTSVRAWMNGTREISLNNAVKIADFFGCTLDYLVGMRDTDERVVPHPLPPFYENLRKVMRETGVTRYRLTEKSGLFTESHFSGWAKGAQPDLCTVCLLASYLGVSVDYLTGRMEY